MSHIGTAKLAGIIETKNPGRYHGICGLAVSPNNKLVAIAAWDSEVVIAEIEKLHLFQDFSTISLEEKEKKPSRMDDDNTNFRILHVLQDGAKTDQDIVFSSDSTKLILISPAPECKIRVFDAVSTFKEVFSFSSNHHMWSRQLHNCSTFASEKEKKQNVDYILTSSRDLYARVFDLTGKMVFEVKHHEPLVSNNFVSFISKKKSQNSTDILTKQEQEQETKLIAVGSELSTVSIYDFTTGEKIQELDVSATETKKKPVWFVKFFSDGRRLSVGGEDKLFRIYEVSTGKIILEKKFPAPIYDISFYMNETIVIVTLSDARTTSMFYACNGEEFLPESQNMSKRSKNSCWRASFLSSNLMLVAGMDGEIMLYYVSPWNLRKKVFQIHAFTKSEQWKKCLEIWDLRYLIVKFLI